MDTAPISMVITGPAYEDNPVWYANDAFESLTGYAEADVLGENLRCLQGPETAAEPVATLREATEIWAAAITELQNYRADGTPFDSRVAIAPIPDDTGTISNWVGFQEPVERSIDTSSA
jgi:PAS domain S-box-containing protein